MTKITKYEPNTYQGKITGYSVELSDGTKGYLDDKASDRGLRQGDDVTVHVDVKQNKKGDNYNLLTLKLSSGGEQPSQSHSSSAQPPTAGAKSQLTGKNKFDHKVEAAIQALEFVMDAYKAERIDWPKVTELQKECVTLLWQQIDDIYNSK